MTDLKSQHILITGATGLVGSYVIRYLIQCGYQHITGICRDTSSKALVQDVEHLVKWENCDIRDVSQLSEIIPGKSIIIHCAALVSFDPRQKRNLAKVNIEGTANLVNIALDHDVKHFIHISSIASLGRNANEVLTHEGSKWKDDKNATFYAKTKFLGEMEVWRGQAEGLKVTVLNPGIILGSGFWDVGSNGFFNHVWRGSPFYPPGSNGFVDVRDIARFVEKILKVEAEVNQFLLVGHNVKYHELLAGIAVALDKKAPSIKSPKWVLQLAWRLDHLRSLITGSKPMLTKETANTSMKEYLFDQQRSLAVEGFSYTPLAETLQAIGNQYLIAVQNNRVPMVLNFSMD